MNYSKLFKIIKSPKFWIALIVLITIAVFNLFSSKLIQHLFPDRQPMIDTLFLISPKIMWTQYLTDIAADISPLVLLYFIIKKDVKHLPYYLIVFAFGYSLRGFIILLDPVSKPLGNSAHYGITNILQYGMFPSGHVMQVFIAYYLSKGIVNNWGRIILILCCIVEIIALILSRGHYSIDIVGGILIAYFVVNELKKRKSSFAL